MRTVLTRALYCSIVAAACIPLAVTAQVQSQAGLLCGTYVICNERGTVALQQGRLEDAIQLFEHQAGLAELV